MNLIIKHKNNTFNFNLKRRITIIDGNSATGKTLFAKAAMAQSNRRDDLKVFGLLEGINEKTFKMEIDSREDSIIIIDRANLHLTENIIDIINQDYDNKYILIGRVLKGIEAAPDTLAEIIYEPNNRTFKLKHYF